MAGRGNPRPVRGEPTPKECGAPFPHLEWYVLLAAAYSQNRVSHHCDLTSKRCALDMHVLKTEPIIAELRVPIGSAGLLLHLRRRAIVLWGDAPGGGNIPAHQVGRGVWSLGVRIAHASRGSGVHPPAVLPLLRIDPRWGGWHEGVMGGRMRDRCSRGVLHGRDDGGRGPG